MVITIAKADRELKQASFEKRKVEAEPLKFRKII
jgi:hypothetical protein